MGASKMGAWWVAVLMMHRMFVVQGATVVEHNETNWAGNIVYGRDRFFTVSSVENIRTLVRAEENLTTLGARHCFNSIADNDYSQLSLRSMNKVLAINAQARTVTVEAGIRYAELAPYLDRHGFALHNLASLADISVAGAISTATHGSGDCNGNLATAVAGLEFVTAEGTVRRFARGGAQSKFDFHGIVVGLGALGVITRITLDIQPTYTVRQFVYENLPLVKLEQHFDAIASTCYSVSFFTDWQNQVIKQVWIKCRDGHGQSRFAAPEKYFDATLARRNLHPYGISPENCTQQMGIPGPWYDRLPHFRLQTTPVVGNELQSEYFVPRQHAVEAILAIESLRDQIGPHLLISEIRTVAADELWMSTAYGRSSVGIHFTWKNDWPSVKLLLPVIEAALSPFHPRPHWGSCSPLRHLRFKLGTKS